MSSIADHIGVDVSGYTRSLPTPPPAEFQSEQSLLPRRDPTLRFSAPYIPGSFPSSDTLRGFHLGSMIPQYRIPIPGQASAQGAGTTVLNASVTANSSTSTETT